MNIQNLRSIIQAYKDHFKSIHKKEIYKWRAAKCFQDNWDIDAKDFTEMLDKSCRLGSCP